ncbi:hypothetical protein Snoj_30120 [Streptomyces nojiriensis]|uniref:Uncharacterized protein n=1 Tax=Streptomyces nojiriensis TaxID=66374 RepID=A0ABQ3SLW1_9ACTN|nr:hypothetical protein GCM10010205_52300 [Streptomyces nojiriensis]GHI69094.1 hypothetical protein Snoj_30120 [Streptomyces nojiriensis]
MTHHEYADETEKERGPVRDKSAGDDAFKQVWKTVEGEGMLPAPRTKTAPGGRSSSRPPSGAGPGNEGGAGRAPASPRWTWARDQPGQDL